MDEKISRPREPKVPAEKDVVYDLVDVVEEPRIDAIVGGRLQDEIMKKVAEVAERSLGSNSPALPKGSSGKRSII